MDELVELICESELIKRQRVKLRSGKTAAFYIDMKKGFGNPELLKLVAARITEQLPDEVTCVAGSGYGGLPVVAAISLQSGLPAVYVRDTAKKHGLGGLIGGYKPSNNDKIAVVDDVYTTGSSLLQTIDNLDETGATITSCHVVVKRGSGELPVPLLYLLTLDDLRN